MLHAALLLLALRLIPVLLGFVQRGGVFLCLLGRAQLFLVVVRDEIIGGLGIDHQLDRRGIVEIVNLVQQGGYLVEEFFVGQGRLRVVGLRLSVPREAVKATF